MAADTTGPRFAVEADLTLRSEDFRIRVVTSDRGDALVVRLPGESLASVRDLGVRRLSHYAAKWIAATGQNVSVEIDGREVVALAVRKNWIGTLLRLPVGVSVLHWPSLRALLFSR